MRQKFTRLRGGRITALAVVLALALAGVSAAVAVTAETTGTVTACASATVDAQTISANGAPIATIPQKVASHCETTTYTVPTVTTTVQETTTVGTTTTTGTTTTSGPSYSVVADSGNSVTAIAGGLTAQIAGGADTEDTAYGLYDFGAQTGRTYLADTIGLAKGQTLTANLAVAQLRDQSSNLVYELYLQKDGSLHLWSPAGGLSGTSLNLATGAIVPNDGSTVTVEVAALANDSVTVRVDGADKAAAAGFTGATSVQPRYVRAGIDHYDSTSTAETVAVSHTNVAIGSAWLDGSTVGGGGGSTTTTATAPTTTTTTSSGGTVLTRGDYETGDFSQWSGTQYIAGNGTGVYTSPVRQGKYAAKFVVNAGDDPINSSGERAEVYFDQAKTDGYQGHEDWYAWSTMFQSGTTLYNGTWNLFSQWHDTSNTDPCSPPMRLGVDSATHDVLVYVWGGNVNYSTCSGDTRKLFDLGPISFGAWHDFIVHVKWATDSTGFVEVYMDGKKVVPLTYTPTLYAGSPGMYWKQGLYRGAISSGSSVVYQDGAVVAKDYAGAITAFPAGSWPTGAPA